MKHVLFLGIGLLVLSGCSTVASVQPIYHHRDLVFLPELLGTWTSPDSSETAEISRGKGKFYHMVGKKSDGSSEEMYEFGLTKIGKTLLVDIPEAGTGGNEKESCPKKAETRHFFARIEIVDKDHVRVATPDPKWFSDYLKAHPKAVRHEIQPSGQNESVTLTGSTRQVRKFLKKHLKHGDAMFAEPDEVIRKADH